MPWFLSRHNQTIKRGIKMENRINWSDQDWAKHLGIEVKDLPRVRNFINDNYDVATVRNQFTNKYSVALYKYHKSPSGFKTLQLMATANQEFAESAQAVKYANEQFLSKLEMTDLWAKSLNMPKRALQLLSIRER